MTKLPEDGLPQLHLIRVLSMLGIFFHHAWNGLGVSAMDGFPERILGVLFQWGGLGVVFFNIISGFLLALPYPGASRRPLPRYAPFLKHRLLRILPQYYLALLLFSVGNALIFGGNGGMSAGSVVFSFVKHALFLQTFQYSMLFSNMAAYWYLCLLVQFYLLFPWLLKLFTRVGAARSGLLICAFCWGGCEMLARYLASHPDSPLGMTGYLIYFNLPARLPEFAAGMWMAQAWQPGRRPLLRIPFRPDFAAFAGGALLFVLLGMPFASGMTLPLLGVYNAACCLVVFIALFLMPYSAQWGRSLLVTRLAAASYSIYLVHQPLLSYSGPWLAKGLGPLPSLVLIAFTAGPACYMLARWIDNRAEGILAGVFPRARR